MDRISDCVWEKQNERGARGEGAVNIKVIMILTKFLRTSFIPDNECTSNKLYNYFLLGLFLHITGKLFQMIISPSYIYIIDYFTEIQDLHVKLEI